MVLDPAVQGPHRPVAGPPGRVPGSVRRTSSIDTTRPDGLGGRLQIEGRARDLVTQSDGRAMVVGEAVVELHVDPDYHVVDIRSKPAVPAIGRLIGSVVGPGFRRRVDELVPDERQAGSLLYLLLDDLPGAALVSGYALLRGGAIPATPEHNSAMLSKSDLCAGWAGDGSLMTLIRLNGRSPTPMGPPAPPLGSPDDDLAWHQLAPLPTNGMRRCRRLDVISPTPDRGGRHRIDAFFRDSHVADAGHETIVHEYSVDATVDAAGEHLVTVSASADVLPWIECPAAIASAARLEGVPLAGLRPWVRKTLVGRTTCTHLNDTLRSLTDISALLQFL
jgi:hypothetical protein